MTGAAAQTDLLQTLIVFRPTFHVYQQYLPTMNSEPLCGFARKTGSHFHSGSEFWAVASSTLLSH